MVRISKLSDYAILLLTQFAADPAQPVKNARDLARQTHMPAPTVSKILKALARGELLLSHRGVKGGYSLARAPDAISIAEVILAIDGPITLTDCSSDADGLCALETRCPLRSNWMRINQVVRGALEQLKLADMATPLPRAVLRTLGASAVAATQQEMKAP